MSALLLVLLIAHNDSHCCVDITNELLGPRDEWRSGSGCTHLEDFTIKKMTFNFQLKLLEKASPKGRKTQKSAKNSKKISQKINYYSLTRPELLNKINHQTVDLSLS
jgi:hypothetical protein